MGSDCVMMMLMRFMDVVLVFFVGMIMPAATVMFMIFVVVMMFLMGMIMPATTVVLMIFVVVVMFLVGMIMPTATVMLMIFVIMVMMILVGMVMSAVAVVVVFFVDVVMMILVGMIMSAATSTFISVEKGLQPHRKRILHNVLQSAGISGDKFINKKHMSDCSYEYSIIYWQFCQYRMCYFIG